jgi:hypothetical protein
MMPQRRPAKGALLKIQHHSLSSAAWAQIFSVTPGTPRIDFCTIHLLPACRPRKRLVATAAGALTAVIARS